MLRTFPQPGGSCCRGWESGTPGVTPAWDTAPMGLGGGRLKASLYPNVPFPNEQSPTGPGLTAGSWAEVTHGARGVLAVCTARSPQPGSLPGRSIVLPPWPRCPWRPSPCCTLPPWRGLMWPMGWWPRFGREAGVPLPPLGPWAGMRHPQPRRDSTVLPCTGCAWRAASPRVLPGISMAHEVGGETHGGDKPTGTPSQMSPGALSPGPTH